MSVPSALLGVVILSAATSAMVAMLLRPEGVEQARQGVVLEPGAGVTTEQHQALVREVEELRRALAERLDTPASRPSREPAGEEPRAPDAATLLARVASLEDRLARYPSAESLSSFAELTQLEPAAEPEVPVPDLQARALDPSLDAEERVRMLSELRGQVDELGNDARSPAVVDAMIAIAESTQDEGLRANVWRQLDGSTEPTLRDPLLRSLQLDPSADVRSEAAETLGHFASDPLVENALRHVAMNDPDEDVREEAQRSLE